jgi:hypothetical protein
MITAECANNTETIKALSLWQPWASLIPMGVKNYETRSWGTHYRGKLLICSAKANSSELRDFTWRLAAKHRLLLNWNELPLGSAIAICDLTDCFQMTESNIVQQSELERAVGDWRPGRYAWKLENIQSLSPAPIKGKQGLFNVSLSVISLPAIAQVCAAGAIA